MKKNSWVYFFNPLVIGSFLFLVLLFTISCPHMAYDEGLWSYIGRIWVRNGLPPYLESIENKPPGIFFLFAISEIISNGSFLFVRILGALSVLASSFLIYRIVTLLHDKLAATISMYIFGLTSCWYVFDGYILSQTEVFMVFFSLLAFYFLTKITRHQKFNCHIFLVGVFMGLAISFKQISVTTIIAFLCFYFIYALPQNSKKEKIAGFILLILGVFSTLILICFILFAFFGISVLDYINGTWLILLNKGSKAPDMGTRLEGFFRFFVFSKFVLFYPFLILGIYSLRFLKNTFIQGVFLWLIIDFVGASASGYFYGHQIRQILAPLSILIGITIAYFYNKEFFLMKIKKPVLVVLIIIVFFPYYQFFYNAKSFFNSKPVIYEKLGDWLKENTKSGDYIYVLGADSNLVRALACSDRVSSSKYFNSLFITDTEIRGVVFKDLKIKTPLFIIREVDDSFPCDDIYGGNIMDFIKSNYSIYKEIDGCKILKLKHE